MLHLKETTGCSSTHLMTGGPSLFPVIYFLVSNFFSSVSLVSFTTATSTVFEQESSCDEVEDDDTSCPVGSETNQVLAMRSPRSHYVTTCFLPCVP